MKPINKGLKPIFLILLSVVLSCDASNEKQSNDYTVSHFGALKNFMHKNDLSAKVDLKDFEKNNPLYGLGALENLKGEVLIWDGKPFISMEKDNSVSVESSFDFKAGLFVYSEVEDWKSYTIPEDVKNYQHLESFIAQTAKDHGIKADTPFPFLLDGNYAFIDWHVINWPEGDENHTHEKHKTSGPHGKLDNIDADVLGFYSEQHHAIYTHHSTNMHMHFKTTAGDLAGHVDDIQISNTVLLLPTIE
ncbi:MAG: acetolactate decarboxylase [Crocinitomicaceae bacterium]